MEAAFRILKEGLLAALPGFTGGGIHEAGEAPDKAGLLFLPELELILAHFIVDIYDVTPQSGLHLPGQPTRDRSPAEMRAEGIARCGYYSVPVSPNLYFEALPVYFRVINDAGVRCRGLQYDSEVLNPHRNRSSGINPRLYGGSSAPQRPHRIGRDRRQPWPFRRDPRDISRLYFQDPDNLSWHDVPCVNIESDYVAFSDALWEFSRRTADRASTAVERRANRIARLNELLRRYDVETPRAQTERRIRQKDWLQHTQAARDRARATNAESADSVPPATMPSVIDSYDVRRLEPGQEADGN